MPWLAVESAVVFVKVKSIVFLGETGWSFMGKLTEKNVIFHGFLYVYQRVYIYNHGCLVVFRHPSEKYDGVKVSWDDYSIPNMMESHKTCSKPPTKW